MEIVRKTNAPNYNIILPDFVQDFDKSLQSYELLLDYIPKLYTTLKLHGTFYKFRLTVQGSTCKEFRKSAQLIRSFLKDRSFEEYQFGLAVSFPLHEFNLSDSQRLLKEMFHIFHPAIHHIPYDNTPHLHLLSETRKELVKYAQELNVDYHKKNQAYHFLYGIESHDTSRPYFIADEVLHDSSFNCVSNQYVRWYNAFKDTYQPNLLYYCYSNY